MRQFKLYNAVGQMYDLNDMGSFLHDPKGLGYEDDSEYERIGSQFLMTGERRKQPNPGGKIRFKSYEGYLGFTKFLQRKPLKLQYTAADTYMMDVHVKSIKKTELETLGLVVEIVFQGLGPWYKELVLQIDGSILTGKVYPYTYPYTYASNSQGTVTIESDSDTESPVQITIIGPCENPQYVHYVNDEIVASGRINCELPAGKRMKISSKLPYSIKELDSLGRETADLYQYSDFLTERFLIVRRGTNVIAFSHDGDEDIKVVVEACVYYDTV